MRTSSQKARRPAVTHLNADTSWLIQIPYSNENDARGDRLYYNILIDPWFSGSQSDVASWFSSQEHAIPSSVQSIAELEDRLHEYECLERKAVESSCLARDTCHTRSHIDVILISHEFTDHCHQATLLEVDKGVPVVATDKAVSLIKSWKHFDVVIATPLFEAGTDWRKTSISPLPRWLGISRLVSSGNTLYYHSALLIAVKKSIEDDNAEAIIYSPHGIEANELNSIRYAAPAIDTLALLHGLHNVSMTSMFRKFQLNLGAYNGLKAQRATNAKHWISTHDEVKIARGLVAMMLKRVIISVQEALDEEKSGADCGPLELSNVTCIELASGDCHLLV